MRNVPGEFAGPGFDLVSLALSTLSGPISLQRQVLPALAASVQQHRASCDQPTDNVGDSTDESGDGVLRNRIRTRGAAAEAAIKNTIGEYLRDQSVTSAHVLASDSCSDLAGTRRNLISGTSSRVVPSHLPRRDSCGKRSS
jgi:hypothetical protein